MSGTSGTYAFNPALSELVIDAYERCGVVASDMTVQNQKIASARRSANLWLSQASNKGINLWTVDEVSQYMPQGVVQYFDDASCIDVLADSVTLRQYLMAASVNVTPDFTTVASSTSVTIAGFSDTPSVGGYINIGVPIGVGGTVVSGFYTVDSVPASNSAVITVENAATDSVTSGGQPPLLQTTTDDDTITVQLINHGYVAGDTFTVSVTTSVGGVTLLGPYTIASIVDLNSFTFTAPYPAGFTDSALENDGDAMLATQTQTTSATAFSTPTDLRMYPLSRTDYVSIPNKLIQGRPTSYWLDRQVVPVFNVWQAPDANGPYELRYRRQRQIQDADITSGKQMELPYRFLEAFTAGLAALLAQKWATDRFDKLMLYAEQKWMEAAAEDTEKTSHFLVPDLSGYYS